MKKLSSLLCLLFMAVSMSAQDFIVKGNKEITLNSDEKAILAKYGLTDGVYAVNSRKKLNGQIKSKEATDVKTIVYKYFEGFFDEEKDAKFLSTLPNIENIIILSSRFHPWSEGWGTPSKFPTYDAFFSGCKVKHFLVTYKYEQDGFDNYNKAVEDYLYVAKKMSFESSKIVECTTIESFEIISLPTVKREYDEPAIAKLNYNNGAGYTPCFDFENQRIIFSKQHNVKEHIYLFDEEYHYDESCFENCVGMLKTSYDEKEIIKGAATKSLLECSEITFPNTLKFVGKEFLRGASAKKITFDGPTGVLQIGESAFSDCRNLKELTFNQPVIIGQHSFYRCGWINSLYFNYTIQALDYSFGETNVIETVFGGNVNIVNAERPSEAIYTTEFAGFKKPVQHVNGIKAKLAYIPKGTKDKFEFNEKKNTAIRECEVVNEKLYIKGKHVKIEVTKPGTILSHLDPSELTNIDTLTVQGYLYTTDVDIINKCKFLKYLDLSNTIITRTPQEQADKKAEEEALIAMFKGMGVFADAQYNDMSMSTVDYYTVKAFTSLFEKAEANQKAIAECLVPKDAFKGMIRLRTIKFPKLAKYIESDVCEGCYLLKDMTLPQYLESIGSDAFSGCESLRTIEFPKTLQGMKDYAFKGCLFDDVDMSHLVTRSSDRYALSFGARNTFKMPQVTQEASYTDCYRLSSSNKIDAPEKIVYFTDNIRSVIAKNKELHFVNPNPPRDCRITNCTIYCPKDSKTAYFAKCGDSNKYIEE